MLLDNGFSILLDMTPLDPFGEDPRRGVLKIDSKNHAFSRTTVANFSMNAVRFIMIFDVFGAISTDSTRLSMVAVSGAETIINDLERRGIVAPRFLCRFWAIHCWELLSESWPISSTNPIGEYNLHQ